MGTMQDTPVCTDGESPRGASVSAPQFPTQAPTQEEDAQSISSMESATRYGRVLKIMSGKQRHHPRLSVRTLACTACQLDGVTILNLGEGGMSIQAPAPLTLSSSIHVRCGFACLDGFIEACGEIAWMDPSGRAGIRFSSLPKVSRARLIEWLFRSATSADSAAKIATTSYGLGGVDPLQQKAALIRGEGSASRRDDVLRLSAVIAANHETATGELDFDAILKLIVERAQLLTRAAGAAIALATGDAMVCRVTSGAAAPDLGARLTPGSGLCAEVLRTGAIVQCDDAEMDLRTHWPTCQRLGIRSIIVVPLDQQGTIIGLLGVFSDRAYGFDSYDVATLERMARLPVTIAIPIAAWPNATPRSATGWGGNRG